MMGPSHHDRWDVARPSPRLPCAPPQLPSCPRKPCCNLTLPQNSTLLWEMLPAGVMDECLHTHHRVMREVRRGGGGAGWR